VVTPKQIQLVRSSWAAVAPIQQQAAAIFYDKLFAADPSLRALFKSNMQEQQRKLMSMIGVAVARSIGSRRSCLPCGSSDAAM
jgi:hemoglobin-like flavoprotein